MLSAGQQLGVYRVISPLGAGGMGEVYLAEDTRLHRRVALKVLPAAMAEDEVSRKRLLREAQAAATLDHPNICTVYDIGDADGHSYIAMQFVEGETLAARMRRRPLDLKTALSIGAQVAAALAEAHKHGIIHRDIKPQNVMLTPSGQVKVLDFGLAKLMAPVEGGAVTETLLTDISAVAGTVPYMSPEQLRGELLDVRTDVFSFGTMLYEAVGRAHPFTANSRADTIAAILTREPAALVNPSTPGELQRILRKSLDKDRERRYQTMRDLAIDLENVSRDVAGPVDRPSDPTAAPVPLPVPASPRLWRRAALVGAGLVVAITAGLFLLVRSRPAVMISSTDFVQITNLPDVASQPAISPDGRMVAFIRGSWFLGEGQIYVKQLPDGDATQLTRDDLRKYGPTFTPDGSRGTYTGLTGYGAGSMSWDTYSVPVLGGEPRKILPNAAGLTWIDRSHLLFSEPGAGIHMGVVTATEDRSSTRRVYFPAHERAMAHLSALSPDHRWILVVQMSGGGGFERCQLVPFEGAAPARPIGPTGVCEAAAWSPDGDWMYFSGHTGGTGNGWRQRYANSHLWRQRFPDGSPEPLTAGDVTGEEGVALAADGRSLITSVGQVHRSLLWHDAGVDRPVLLEGNVLQAVISRDSKRAYCLVRANRGSGGLSVVDLASGQPERILTEFYIVDFAVSRDDQRLAFTSVDDQGRTRVWLAPLDKSTQPRQIALDADEVVFGKNSELIYRSLTGTVNNLYWVDDGGQPQRISDRQIADLIDVSPDGEWAIAVAPTTEATSGLRSVEIKVHSGEVKDLCSGTCDARWSVDGRRFYAEVRTSQGGLATYAFPLPAGKPFPDVPPDTLLDTHLWDNQPGVLRIDRSGVVPGSDPSKYGFITTTELRNLFRVNLR